jgi:PAS domain-containing protein/two-component sensor histidine kinase
MPLAQRFSRGDVPAPTPDAGRSGQGGSGSLPSTSDGLDAATVAAGCSAKAGVATPDAVKEGGHQPTGNAGPAASIAARSGRPNPTNVDVTRASAAASTSPAPGRLRDETAGARDQAAQKRDELATRRDRQADLADRQVLEREDGDGVTADKPTSQVQELHARALADHERAAGDRVRAKQDREFGQRDRADSKRDREYARADGRSLAAAESAGRDLAQQRTQLLNAQSVGQFGSWEWDVATDTAVWSGELWRARGLGPSGTPVSFEQFVQSVHADDRAVVRAQVAAAYKTGDPFCFEHRIVRADGNVRVIHARGEVVMGSDGTPVTMRGTGQDITERHDIERAKDEFISIVSHELRTPLTAIRCVLGMLASGALGPLPDEGQGMVEIAVANTDRLVRLINDILDIERIDSGTIETHPQSCDAAQLITRAIECVAQVAADAQVTLIAEGEPAELCADPDRVLQVLTNLISNAVKFSAADSTVRVGCVRRGDEVLFAVADNGRGIPADKLGAIFERFAQVDASDARENGGSGLGLAICRKIIEHLGGRIWVQSELGAGSTFSFAVLANQAVGSAASIAAER